MRCVWWMALVLLIPAGLAQSETVLVADDGAGDGSPVEGPTDLISLEATWLAEGIQWKLERGDNTVNGNTPVFDGADFRIHFQLGERPYTVFADRSPFVAGILEGPNFHSGLQELRNGLWVVTQSGDAPVEEGNTLQWVTPYAWLRNEQDIPFLPGQSLDNVWMESSGFVEDLASIRIASDDPVAPDQADRMPNDGFAAPLVRPASEGVASEYRLFTDSPVRTSNGGPMTVVFDMDLFNGASEAKTFELAMEDAPDWWTVRTVPARITVDALSTEPVVAVIRADGAHQHGADEVMTFTARTDDGEAIQNLTIHFPSIPELSGHHPHLWFHNQEAENYFGPLELDYTPSEVFTPNGPMWMNTLDVDEADEGKPMASSGIGQGYRAWDIALGPAPRLGFDFDMDGAGEVRFAMAPYQPAPIEGVAFDLSVDAFVDGNWTSVADIPSVETFTLEPEGASFALPVVPTHDVVAYQPDLQLRLRITYDYAPTSTSTGGGTNGVALLPGGNMILPMEEYQDPLTPEMEALLREEGVLDDAGDIVLEATPAPKSTPVSPGLGLIAVIGVAWARRP